MGANDFTAYDLIRRNALIFNDKEAWMEEEGNVSLTFAQVKIEVDRIALALDRIGVKKGDRVGLLAKNSPELFLVIGACAGLGAVAVPVNWRLSVEEAAYNLNDSQPRCVLVDCDPPEWVAAVCEKLPPHTGRYRLRATNSAFEPLPLTADVSEPLAPAPVNADDPLIMIHTAAVTGNPKGALLSHANLLWANLQMMYIFGTVEKDVNLSLLPLFHIGGLGMAFQAFHAGALNINMRKFDAARAVELITAHKVTQLIEFAPILKSILDQQNQTGLDITSLRVATGLDAGETIERYQQETGGTFYTLYGQTETSLLTSMGRYNDCPGAAGKPLPLTDIQIVDDADRPAASNQIGEITVKGPMVFCGYWNLETETAETFRGGRHHTGDMGHLDGNGFLWYAGRKPEKELIKPGGENVYPAEVEKAILEHPAIQAVAVIGVPDPKWKEGIKAVCVLKPGRQLSAKALIDFVGQRIARFKKPQYVEFVTALPQTASGAIDRARVKALYGA